MWAVRTAVSHPGGDPSPTFSLATKRYRLACIDRSAGSPVMSCQTGGGARLPQEPEQPAIANGPWVIGQR